MFVDGILSRVRAVVRAYQLTMVVIDDFQSVARQFGEDPSQNRQEVAESIKALAEELQIPVVLVVADAHLDDAHMSFDAVDLRLGSRGCFDHGQLYTALSRCRSLEGLHIDRCVVPADLIVDDAVVKFCSAIEKRGAQWSPPTVVDGESAATVECGEYVASVGGDHRAPRDVETSYYPEAMQYYLRRIETGSGELPPSGIKQFEFDFAPRVQKHPDLDKLLQLDEACAINKYDAPILHPLADAYCSGNGVTEDDLQMISRLVRKYDVDGVPSMVVGT